MGGCHPSPEPLVVILTTFGLEDHIRSFEKNLQNLRSLPSHSEKAKYTLAFTELPIGSANVTSRPRSARRG
jgi:hypothetical protein